MPLQGIRQRQEFVSRFATVASSPYSVDVGVSNRYSFGVSLPDL
jgi:hypothetical protein